MKSFKNFAMKSLFAVIAIMFFTQAASAFEGAVLKGIRVDSNNNNYKITVKTDKDTSIKKYVTASNKIVLELKNTIPSDFVNTVYNGATEIDHVIVQPLNGNKIRIFLQGLNIATSKVILDTRDEALEFIPRKTNPVLETVAALPATNQIKTLAKPAQSNFVPIRIDLSEKNTPIVSHNKPVEKVRSITPIYSYEDRSNAVNTETGLSLAKLLEANTFDWGLRILALVALIFAGIKLFKKPATVNIDLSANTMKSREMDLYKSINDKKERLTRSLGLPAQKESVVEKPNYSALSQYGMKEYQNSQKPPKRTQPATTPINTPKKTPTRNAGAAVQSIKPQTQRKPVQARPTAPNTTKVRQPQIKQAQAEFDGVKFLETMATIYQKSGRGDLATGIRQNIINKKQNPNAA